MRMCVFGNFRFGQDQGREVKEVGNHQLVSKENQLGEDGRKTLKERERERGRERRVDR